MDHLIAADIVEHLRQGTVPIEYVEEFSVGRAHEFAEARRHMERVERGDGQLSFVNGPYGSGKTHFLSMLRAEALRRNFAVTHVVLSTQSCPLDRLQTVFAALMRGLNTPECRDRPAFRWVLDTWVSTIERELLDSGMAAQDCKHGLPYSTCARGCFADLLARAVSGLEGLHPDFALVLTGYFNANWGAEPVIMRFCERWLLGEALPAADRKRIARAAHREHYPKNISNRSALHAFGDAARIMRSIGCRGLVVMLDEAETMPSVGRGGEIVAFVNLVKLMRACLNEWQRIYCLYATTPFFEYMFKTMYGQVVASIKNDEVVAWIQREFQKNRITLDLPDQDDLRKLAGLVYAIYRTASDPQDLAPVPGRAWVMDKADSIVDSIGTNAPIRRFVTALMGEIDAFRSSRS